MNPDLLIINSYAGSLTIAAQQLKLPVRGSYEDTAFGIEAQKLNFPKLKYVDHYKDWPKDDLRNTVVIAHPPCAAFSPQNAVKNCRGTQAESFRCHIQVMDYALGQGAVALAMESVTGALEGARQVHDRYAKKYGYHVYRVLQNAVTFGVPQWRPRFWIIFSKQKEYEFIHKMNVRSVGSILVAKGTPPLRNGEADLIFKRLEKVGYKYSEAEKLFMSGEDCGNLLAILRRKFEMTDTGDNHREVRERFNLEGLFGTKMPRALNPESWAPTILRDSAWYCVGRRLYEEEYHGIMGFPEKYKWPDKMRPEFRTYLSKGVCPPVAKWILQHVWFNEFSNALGLPAGMSQTIKPGEVADFSITKKLAEEKIK